MIADNSKVICPQCVHQFTAISVDDQKRIRLLEAALEAWERCDTSQPLTYYANHVEASRLTALAREGKP